MKRNIFLLCKMQTQSLLANIEVTRFILQTQRSLYSTCLSFYNTRSPAVITHKEPLTQACANITYKYVPASLKNEVEIYILHCF